MASGVKGESEDVLPIRPATSADAPAIRALIRRVRINPTGLDWRRFLVAEGPEGMILACGQIKPHGDGTFELASVAVDEAWRGQRRRAGDHRTTAAACRSTALADLP